MARGLLITVRDVAALIASRGGKTGIVAQSLIPDTIEKQVYDRMAGEIYAGMAAKGVDADVKVVDAGGFKIARASDLATGALLGAGAVGLGWLLWHYGRRLF